MEFGVSSETSQGDCDLDKGDIRPMEQSRVTRKEHWNLVSDDCTMRTTNYTAAIKLLNSLLYRSVLHSFTEYTRVGARIWMQWKGWVFPRTTRSL